MGKLHISEDLKHKLNKVLNFKTDEETETKLNTTPLIEKPILKSQKVEQKENIDNQVDFLNLKTTFEISYFKIAKMVFFTSVIGGIGLTLGLKLGRIIFW